MLYLIAAAFLAILIAAILDNRKKKKRLDAEAEKLGLKASPGSVNYECLPDGFRFAVSADRSTVYMIYDPEKPTLTVPSAQITGCEIVRDGASGGSVGRAVVGGAVAGAAGAVVGAVSGSQVPQRYSLLIYMNDLKNPLVEYSLMGRHTGHSKSRYENVSRFAESVAAAVRVLISQTQG